MHPNDGRMISNFIVQSLGGEPITIYGDGKQTRSFCYVDDLIAGLSLLMDFPKEITGPIDLGNREEVTILEATERIRSLTASRSEIIFKPFPENDPHRRCPDIRRAKRILNWEPRVSFADGLRMTIDYFGGVLRSRERT